MKKITTSVGVFGPFSDVKTLDDRYHADGADLPFVVVGQGDVTEWTDAIPEPLPVPTPIPQSVSPRQIRQALTRAGLRASVEAAVAAGDQDTQDWYYFSNPFERGHQVVSAMGAALGVSDAQLDALWVLAYSL